VSVEQLEALARANEHSPSELLVLKNELGFRETKRARELADLVARLIRAAEE
jgi:hypothetical protein